MKCIIKEIEKDRGMRIGEPKEIIVDSVPWEKDGETGNTYSFHMSQERFERDNLQRYEIYIENDAEDGEDKVKLCTMGYYDFVDFDFKDCISERQVAVAAEKLNATYGEVVETIEPPLKELEAKIRGEFAQTEEAKAKKEHEEILHQHNKAKRDFTMQYGFSGVDYDRCYNVFGQLMDGVYLAKLHKILEEREKSMHQSKKYRKSEYQKRFHEYLHSSQSTSYTEEEQIMLSKFYKVLAKKYHPDANPGIDTTDEMTLLNKVKKEWNV